MVENEWWVTQYGDPCRECGFDWSQSAESAVGLVESLSERLTALLDGRSGNETFPGATWSAAEVTRGPAHDAVHHCWDVARATGARATAAATPPDA